MKLKSILFVLPFFVGFEALAGNNQSVYKTDVTIDGQNKEWKTPLPIYNENTGIHLEVGNDERNIYFILNVSDTTSLRQIQENGLEVWINRDGKKKNTTGITYPMAPDKAKAGSKTKVQTGKTADGFSMNINELMLTGFLLENGRQPVKGCPVKVAIKKDSSNCIVYEVAIPFNSFYKEKLEKEDLKNKFYIGFVIKGVTVDMDAAPRIMMTKMAMNGGGFDGPRMGGGMAGMMSMFGDVDKIFWQKIQFSLNKNN
jgi:hypothetical protein